MADMQQASTKPRVLFVEDEAVIRDHLVEQLSNEFEVEAVGDGEAALRAVLRNRPDLVVTDLLMPALDGVELVRTLRNTPSTATIPILMISGRAPEELRLEGFELGADAFLGKPHTERELRIRMRSLLQSAQVRQEAARREAQERAEQEAIRERAILLESISDAFYAVDSQWRVSYANQRALDYFGKSRNELIGKNLWDAVPVGKGTRIEAEYRSAMRMQRPASFEILSPLSGRWIEVHAYPTPQGLAINFRDVTVRKQAENALRESERWLRAAVLASPWPIMLHAEDGEVLELSRKWTELTGYTRDQIRTHFDWFALAYPEKDLPSLCERITQEFRTEGEIKVGAVAVRTSTGSQLTWDFQNVGLGRLPDGRRLQISAAVDVTERLQAEQALRKHADEFHALADNIPALCWMAYADGSIYWYNRRWYDYTGTTADTQQGWGWESAHDPEMLPKVKERWGHSLTTGEPFEMTFPLRGADGTFRSFLTRVVPIRDTSGCIVRWFGTNTDVSAQLAIEQELRELTGTLEQRVERAIGEQRTAAEQLAHMQKMESIGQLTGGVAHDFNNLLTPIVGALDMLQKRLDDPRSQRITAGALQAAERARALVQQLLAFARKQHLEARPVDIRELLQTTSDLLARTIGPHIGITVRVARPLPPARVDPNQLELALLNLALNARDAMPKGGSLVMTADLETVTGRAGLQPGDYIRICVSDNGVGMDDVTLRRAIEPFYTTKQSGRGTGLGLSMVHGLAAQSGGDLALASAVGEGTTATLWLPVSHEALEASQPAARPMEASHGKILTVLLVDDEDLVRLGTAEMLRDSGYEVLDASSAAQGLALIKEGARVDVIVTDFAMPGMNGMELANALRTLRPDLPILMITGFASLRDEEVGGLPILTKPFRHDELAQSIRDLVRSAQHDSRSDHPA